MTVRHPRIKTKVIQVHYRKNIQKSPIILPMKLISVNILSNSILSSFRTASLLQLLIYYIVITIRQSMNKVDIINGEMIYLGLHKNEFLNFWNLFKILFWANLHVFAILKITQNYIFIHCIHQYRILYISIHF